MKILVPVKRVIDYKVNVRVKSDETGVETENVKMSMNPFDEIAVEQAVRLKEAGLAKEVVAVSIGPDAAEDTIRTAMAIGADRGLLVASADAPEPLAVAKLLKAVTDEERPDLVLMGKQAIDDDANQTGQMLAALLGWGQGTFVSGLEVAEGAAIVTREVDGGLQRLRLALPAVVTTDLGLCAPRNATLPNVIKAKKKPMETRDAASFGVDLAPRLVIDRVTAPPERAPGTMVSSVDELLERLGAETDVFEEN